SLAYRKHPRLLLVTTALSVVVQSANVLVVWLIGMAMQAPVPWGYYWFLVPTVTVLTLLPVSLNGMGIREGGTAVLLAPLGVGDERAVCLSVLWFSIMTAASAIGGAVYFFGSLSKAEVASNAEPIGDRPDQGRAGQSEAAA